MDKKLQNKTMIWNGDSICAGGKLSGNWASRICEKNNMKYKNYAVGGGTISTGYPVCQGGVFRHSVLETIDKMHEEYPDADYVILEGGTNDADLIELRGNPANLSVGEIDPNDFSGNYDLSTFTGCMETVIFKTLKFWNGKKIGFIIPQKMGCIVEEFNVRRKYFDIEIEILEKWGIPYIDLWHSCYLNPNLFWMHDSTKTAEENHKENTGYYVDNQHMTALGYDYTGELIENWILSL